MSVYFDRARDRWRYDFEHARKRYAGYCVDPTTAAPATNRSEAKRIEKLAKANVITAPARAALPTPPGAYTLAQAIAARLPLEQRRRDFAGTRHHLAELGEFFGLATPIAAIDDAAIRAYQSWSLARPRRTYVGGPRKRDALGARPAFKTAAGTRAIATTNHYVKTLLRVLRLAHETRAPGSDRRLLEHMPRAALLKEPAHVPRPIAPEDLARIRNRARALGASHAHVADLVELAFHFGLRLREATHATIDQVDFAARGLWLEAARTKARRGEFVPANADGLALLRRLVKRARKAKQTRLILRQRAGRRAPVDDPTKAFDRIAAELGLDRHTFHNTKASFVTQLARTAPAAVVQRAARHKDFRTTQRYLAVVDADLRAALNTLPSLSTPTQKARRAPHGRIRKIA